MGTLRKDAIVTGCVRTSHARLRVGVKAYVWAITLRSFSGHFLDLTTRSGVVVGVCVLVRARDPSRLARRGAGSLYLCLRD